MVLNPPDDTPLPDSHGEYEDSQHVIRADLLRS